MAIASSLLNLKNIFLETSILTVLFLFLYPSRCVARAEANPARAVGCSIPHFISVSHGGRLVVLLAANRLSGQSPQLLCSNSVFPAGKCDSWLLVA